MAQDIPNRGERVPDLNSLSVSASPEATFHSPPWIKSGLTKPAKQLKPFDHKGIKILLLENVNQSGKDILAAQGYQVESLKSSLPEDQLIEKIRYVAPPKIVAYHLFLKHIDVHGGYITAALT